MPSASGTRQRLLCTRQRLCRVRHSAKGTRKKNYRESSLCRVPFVGHSAKPLPSAKELLPSAESALGKERPVTAPVPLTAALPSANPAGTRQRFFNFFFENFFAECHGYGTRQSWKTRVSGAHIPSFAECHGTRQSSPLPSAMVMALGKAGKLLDRKGD